MIKVFGAGLLKPFCKKESNVGYVQHPYLTV